MTGWRRFRRWFRCARRGHPLGRELVDLDGTVHQWCGCGRPWLPNYYVGEDGRAYLHGHGPEPWR